MSKTSEISIKGLNHTHTYTHTHQSLANWLIWQHNLKCQREGHQPDMAERIPLLNVWKLKSVMKKEVPQILIEHDWDLNCNNWVGLIAHYKYLRLNPRHKSWHGSKFPPSFCRWQDFESILREFWYTTTLFKHVWNAWIRDKTAQTSQNKPKFRVLCATKNTGLKKTPPPVVTVVTNISYGVKCIR